jgi:hypothetical protein
VAWLWLQSASAVPSAGTSASVAFSTANLSSGSTVVATAAISALTGSGITGISMTCGGTSMVAIKSVTSGSGGSECVTVLFALNTPAGQVGTKPTVTVSWTNNGEAAILAQEVSGLATGATLAALADGTPGGTTGTGGASASCGTYSSSVTGEYLVAIYGDNGGTANYTIPGGYSADTHNVTGNNSRANIGIAYKNSTGGAESATYTLAGSPGQWATNFVAFKVTAPTAVTSRPSAMAVRARLPRRPRRGSGYAQGNRGAPRTPPPVPTPGPPFYPLHWPAKARWQRLAADPAGLPVRKGRTYSNPGAPNTTTPYVGQVWTGTSTYDYGLSTIAVSNAPGATLVLLAGWDLSTDPTDAAMASVYPADSAGNYWFHAATTSSGVAGSRCAAWICPNARSISWLSVSATTFVSSLAYIVVEVANMPLYYSLDISDANAASSAASLALAPGTATQADVAFSVFTTGATGLAPATPAGWSALSTVTAGDGAANPVEIFPYWCTATGGTDLGATYSVASAVPVSGITFAVSQSPAAPVQPNPDFPVLKVEAGFGFTPGDPSQPPLLDGGGGTGLGWTDITSRAMGKQGDAFISASMGRTYELSQMEAGELAVACDNHDGALTPGNTSSPYYPDVVVGTPIRVSAFWGTHWYHAGFGWVERWPQQWPDLPQWGMSAMIATDAVAVMSAASMTSALDGDILIDAPAVFLPFSEQYTTFVGGLNPVLIPADAQGLIAADASRVNQRTAIYADGTVADADTGQETSILGDSDSGFGTTSISDAPAIPASGPGAVYTDPSMPSPQSVNGVTVELWVIIPAATAGGLQPVVFSAYGPPSNYGTGAPSLSVKINSFAGSTMTITLADGSTVSAPFNPSPANSPVAQQIVLAVTSSALSVYVNGGLAATASLTAAQTTTWSAVTVGCPNYAYGAGGIAVGNFTAFDFAVYGYQLPVQRILSHYVTGFSGQEGSDATARLAQILSWANLGLPRAGQVLFGDPPTADEVAEGPAYSLEGASAADAVNQVVTNETGQAFATPSGAVQFVHRWALFNQSPVAVFGDDPHAGDGEVPYLPAMSWDYDVTYLRNSNQVQQVVGPNTTVTVSSSDFASQAAYFLRSVQTEQISTTSDLDAYAQSQWQIVKYAQPQLRVAGVTIDAASNPQVAFPVVLAIQQAQAVTAVRRPVGGAVISEPVIVEKVEHRIGPSKWQTAMQLSPYTPESNVLQLDVAGYDILGENTLA